MTCSKFLYKFSLSVAAHLVEEEEEGKGDFEYQNTPIFNLDEVSEPECKKRFRFVKEDIRTLRRLLQVPDTVICENGSNVPGEEAFCLFIERLASPVRLCTLSFVQTF